MPIQMKTPDGLVAGVHADFVGAWHTPDTFVLDFAAFVQPPEHIEGSEELLFNAQVVARVRIPPAQVFEIMKALEQQLTVWEAENGARRPPPTA